MTLYGSGYSETQIGFTRGLSLQAASLSVRKANSEGNAAQVVSIVDLAVYSRQGLPPENPLCGTKQQPVSCQAHAE